jgi:HK97 family phage major capsid protein
MTDSNQNKPDTIWGLPVIINDKMPDNHMYIVCGDWSMKIRGKLEWDGEHYILRLYPPTTVITHDPE